MPYVRLRADKYQMSRSAGGMLPGRKHTDLRDRMKLTDQTIRAAIARTTPYRVLDGDSLYLVFYPT